MTAWLMNGALAIGLRMVTTMGDGMGFLAGLAMRRWMKIQQIGQA